MAARYHRNPRVERVLLFFITIWDWTVAQAVTGLLAVARLLPADKSIAAAAWLGRTFAPILPRFSLAKRNIALAFPEKPESEVEEIARNVWSNVARTIAEYVFLDELFDFDADNPGVGRVEARGSDIFDAIRDGDRKAILFTAHTGNWEMLPISASVYRLEVTALFRPPNNRFLAERLLKARKTDRGHFVPSRAGAAWALAQALDEGKTVGVLADQAFNRGPLIEFLGRPATANPLAVKLARQYDAPLYPSRCVRLPNGRFRLEIEEALPMIRKADGTLDQRAMLLAMNEVMERWIREYPDQWLWLHDRWKLKENAKRRELA